MAARPSVWANAARLVHRTVAAPAVDWAARARAVGDYINSQGGGGGGAPPAAPGMDLSFLNTMSKKEVRQLKNKVVKHKAKDQMRDLEKRPRAEQATKSGPPSKGKIGPPSIAKGTDATTKATGTQKKQKGQDLGSIITAAARQAAGQYAGLTAPAAPAVPGATDGGWTYKPGAKADPNDPYYGMNHYQAMIAGKKLAPNDEQILVSSAANNPYGTDIVMSKAALKAEFYSSDPATRADWQNKLLAAGFYEPESKYYTRKNTADPLEGQLDKDTVKAFDNMLNQASIQNGLYRRNHDDVVAGRVGPLLGGSGEDLDQMLMGRADAFASELENSSRGGGGGSGGRSGGGGDGSGGGGGGGGGTVYQVEDPAQLRALTNVIAQELVGQALPEEQINQIVNTIQQKQQGAQSVTEGTVAQVDEQAQIAAMIRQFQPVQSQAHDIVGMYDSFTKLLGGPSTGSMVNPNTQGF